MSVIIEGLTLPKHNPKEIDKNVLIGYAIVKEDNTAELCFWRNCLSEEQTTVKWNRRVESDL